jgi:hypothetical protein
MPNFNAEYLLTQEPFLSAVFLKFLTVFYYRVHASDTFYFYHGQTKTLKSVKLRYRKF